jgi:hypothetical protein
MSDSDIFVNETPEVDNQEVDYVAELIGEGKPYADQPAAAKALYHKQKHIEKLEAEAVAYRERLQQAVTLEEFMNNVASTKQQPEVQSQPAPTVANEPASDPAFILKTVDERYQALKEQERRVANAARVKNELNKRFGQTYETSLRQRVSELGLTDQEANDLAMSRPDAFLAMLGTPQKPAGDVTPPASHRGFVSPPGKKFKDYQKVYRENPELYQSERFQLEMHREAKRQGPSFYE